MPFIPRRVAVAIIPVVALGAGVGAAPALASARTPLARAIEHANPLVRQRISLKHTMRDGRVITEFRRSDMAVAQNRERCRRYAAIVAAIHADPAQRTAQREWVAGVRLQADGDKQLTSGVLAEVNGNITQGKTEVQAALAKFNRADGLTGHATELLKGDASGPAPELP